MWKIAVMVAVLTVFSARGIEPTAGQYSAAAYVSGGVGGESRLAIFPFHAKELSVRLPFTLRWSTLSASGRVIYARSYEHDVSPRVFKIDLDPVKVSALPWFNDFQTIERFAVSPQEDRLLFVGQRRGDDRQTFGIFETNLRDGATRLVLQQTGYKTGFPWQVIDLSPNSPEALIRTDRRLARLDLVSGEIHPIGNDFWMGSYSPDGKWIGALSLDRSGLSKTILIERKDFSRRRDLGGSEDTEAVWSPDSRFLLHAVYRPFCFSRNPILLETLDIETGKRSAVKSSVCKAGASREMGWVSNKIVGQ